MNEILTSLDRPVDSIVALAEFAGVPSSAKRARWLPRKTQFDATKTQFRRNSIPKCLTNKG